MELISGITALVLGSLMGHVYMLSFKLLPLDFTHKSKTFYFFITSLPLLKIIGVSTLFYMILHHTQLNFILVVSAFFSMIAYHIQKVISHGRSART